MDGFGYLTGDGSRPSASAVLTSQAVRGDRAAIAQLVYWHTQQGDQAVAAAWRGVYRGEPAAMFRLGQQLAGLGDPELLGCAAFWFAQAHAHGHPQAGQANELTEGED